MNNFSHIPVLLHEAVEALKVEPAKQYIDATLGGGGHTEEIIKKGGVVLGIDQDEDALEYVSQRLKSFIDEKKLILGKGNFEDIQKLARDNGFEAVDGILFDLGVSSYQLDSSGRGFSIRNDEELDMRMNKDGKLNAFDVVNSYSESALIDLFYRYGEEHNAKGIAQAITDKRKKEKIRTTKELAGLIERLPHKSEEIHPATRVFQAIRIEVNGELNAVKQGVYDSLSLLNPGGRLAVISFHSLEDRIIKQIFEKAKREGKGVALTKKPIVATYEENVRNRRSRSAKMRIFEKK
jgi:16S rRNA (cytosine1402-N4)-methyltransferase